MSNARKFAKPVLSLLTLVLALSGCAHEPPFKKQRDKCQAMTDEKERKACLQKVAIEERAYERKQNETRIEKSYKRKLEDMRPPT